MSWLQTKRTKEKNQKEKERKKERKKEQKTLQVTYVEPEYLDILDHVEGIRKLIVLGQL